MIISNFLLFFVFISSLLLNSPNVYARDLYSNKDWGFKIQFPSGWKINESKNIVSAMKKKNPNSPEIVQAIENSGVIVNLSKFPIDNNVSFNPNINITAKQIPAGVNISSDDDVVAFSKDLLRKISSKQQEFLEGKMINISSYAGIFADYSIARSKDDNKIHGQVYILFDKSHLKYFIISTFGDEDRILENSVLTFQEI